MVTTGGNTAAAALKMQLFLMFNVCIQFTRFYQLEISEEGDVNVVNGHKHGHMGEPRQVQRGRWVLHWDQWVEAVRVEGGCQGSALLMVSYLLVPGNRKLFLFR